MVREWLSQCETNCESCVFHSDSTLPKRVVDVGLSDGMIKLVETDGKEAPYIALSHCWGTSRIITTTLATLEDRKRGIAEADLSQTFRHAIRTTRELGIAYIWIDSLCIIQDNSLDWQIESAKMASIYENAYLTIAGTRAKDGSIGMFTQTPDFEVSGATKLGERYRLFFRKEIQHVRVMENGDDEHPLLGRAWCFQERLISPRVLHYGPQELSYECQSTVACECDGIEGYETELPQPKWAYGTNFEDDTNDYYRQCSWRSLIMQYSDLGLTKKEDCFPALSGIATQMADVRGARCVAGMWEDSLNDDLLWAGSALGPPRSVSVDKDNSDSGQMCARISRPANWRAPSWSWASTEANIYYEEAPLFWDDSLQDQERNENDFQHFSEIVSCKATPAGPNKFGVLKDGKLQLSGVVIEAELVYDSDDAVLPPAFKHGNMAVPADDPALLKALQSRYKVRLEDGTVLDMKRDYDLSLPGAHQVLSGTPVLCVRMSWITKTALGNESGEQGRLYSLVLRPVESRTDTFERIGLLVLHIDRNDVSIYRDAKERLVNII